MATNSNNNSFDFSTFNNLTNRVPVGMKVYLALQLLSDAQMSLDRFDNPLGDDLREIVSSTKAFRKTYKAESEARAAKTGLAMAADGKGE